MTCYSITMQPVKRPVGGGFMEKRQRNENLRRYYQKHPGISHASLARIFKISRARVTQILARTNHLTQVEGDK